MKKTLRLLHALLLCILFGISFVACGDDDDDEEITNVDRLPSNAQVFLKTYFVDYEVVKVIKDVTTPVEYEVWFRGGGKIKFNDSGDWQEVEGDMNRAVPTGFYPASIDTYVAANYAGQYIHEIDLKTYGFDVDLSSGIDLIFDAQGNFVRVDK